jgi:hypothetical protein
MPRVRAAGLLVGFLPKVGESYRARAGYTERQAPVVMVGAGSMLNRWQENRAVPLLKKVTAQLVRPITIVPGPDCGTVQPQSPTAGDERATIFLDAARSVGSESMHAGPLLHGVPTRGCSASGDCHKNFPGAAHTSLEIRFLISHPIFAHPIGMEQSSCQEPCSVRSGWCSVFGFHGARRVRLLTRWQHLDSGGACLAVDFAVDSMLTQMWRNSVDPGVEH